MTTEQARAMLIEAAKGGGRFYEIDYSVDAKGIITIWGGSTLDATNFSKHFFINCFGDYDTYYYEAPDGTPYGRQLQEMAKQAAEKLTEDDIVAAYRKFCRQRPQDAGYSICSGLANEGTPYRRTDADEVEKELRRRNRAYMKEFFNVDVPEDMNCYEEMQRRMRQENGGH